MKIFKFLYKGATASKIVSQKLSSFPIMKNVVFILIYKVFPKI